MLSNLAASVEVRLVFPTGGPAYVCLGCEEAFLRPGPRGERWLTAVKSGIVWDHNNIGLAWSGRLDIRFRQVPRHCTIAVETRSCLSRTAVRTFRGGGQESWHG